MRKAAGLLFLLLFPLLVFISPAGEAQILEVERGKVQRITVDTTRLTTSALFQAISIGDDQSIWISGHGSNWAVSRDQGLSFRHGSFKNADSLQWRGLHAFDSLNAFLMGAGTGKASQIRRTKDGGRTWAIVYEMPHEKGFIDAIRFFNEDIGLVYGDALNGKLFILRTTDGGNKWKEVKKKRLPSALEGEAGFASSGTNIVTLPDGRAWIGTGGGTASRVLYSTDFGKCWTATEIGIPAGEGAGICSLSLADGGHLMAAGGNLGKKVQPDPSVYESSNAGKTWTAVKRSNAPFCAYGSSFISGKKGLGKLVVGPGGIQYLPANGRDWISLNGKSHWAIKEVIPGVALAFGPKGRMTRISIP